MTDGWYWLFKSSFGSAVFQKISVPVKENTNFRLTLGCFEPVPLCRLVL